MKRNLTFLISLYEFTIFYFVFSKNYLPSVKHMQYANVTSNEKK